MVLNGRCEWNCSLPSISYCWQSFSSTISHLLSLLYSITLLPCWLDASPCVPAVVLYYRGWDGWMASLTRWTWVWVNSGSWWWTGRPGVLQFMGSQRVGHYWMTELNWTELYFSRFCIVRLKMFSLFFMYNLSEKYYKPITVQYYITVYITDCVSWVPHAKSWLIGKDCDAGRDWGQKEKGTTEDEMAGWHHWLDGLESEWTSGVGDGQGGLACCDSWGRKESDTTEWLNWTELRLTLLDLRTN